jgi:hypothetical protein
MRLSLSPCFISVLDSKFTGAQSGHTGASASYCLNSGLYTHIFWTVSLLSSVEISKYRVINLCITRIFLVVLRST